MKKNIILFTIFFLLIGSPGIAQLRITSNERPPIDSSLYGKWPTGVAGTISDDGKYVICSISDPLQNIRLTEFKKTDASWEWIISGSAEFAMGGKIGIVHNADSLTIGTLGSNRRRYKLNVTSYKLGTANAEKWVAYRVKGDSKSLFIYDLLSGDERKIIAIKDFYFIGNNTMLLIQENPNKTNVNSLKASLINLLNGNQNVIWEGNEIRYVICDTKNFQVAFWGRQKNGDEAIWHYKSGWPSAILLADNSSRGLNTGFKILEPLRFSVNGFYLFLRVKEPDSSLNVLPKGGASVDVWSYKDVKLQSEQLEDLKRSPFTDYQAVVSLPDKHLVQLNNKGEYIYFPFQNDPADGKYALLYNPESDGGESNWNISRKRFFSMVSLENGERKRLPEYFYSPQLSPAGKYIIYYDKRSKDYFSYEIKSKIVRNLTKGTKTDWTKYNSENLWPIHKEEPRGVLGWLPNDEAVLVYDRTDIWKLRTNVNHGAENLTRWYGKKHNMVFTLSPEKHISRTLEPGEKLFLSAFNEANKKNGFFEVSLNNKSVPVCLTMGNYVYDYGDNSTAQNRSRQILKAKDSDIFIVTRMSATESPNSFSTHNFKTFTQLTNVYPEKKYSWLTSELVTWKMSDGKYCQGILYKPENFDPKKKYPVIFYYYEELSNGLNAYPPVQKASDVLNFVWYVSNGYLVFMPDIHYQVGKPGQSVLNSVVSAAKYLTTFSFVDSKHIGLQGHSYGGYETNFIVTHSSLFSAACSAAGITDLVSQYGSLDIGGTTLQHYGETTQMRIGGNLWEKKSAYIENSPVFNLNKITTPLLLMFNKDDLRVPFAQGVEFFTGLRRLNKPAWMLQYDDGSHGVDHKSADDYTIRMQQFFDHYLKGYPPPLWMTKGIPARLKGIETGYELDPTGNCGKDCPVCKKKDYKAYYQSRMSK